MDQLPGAILSALILGVLLSLPLSMLLQRLYSRQVLASMRAVAAGTPLDRPRPGTLTEPAPLRHPVPLHLVMAEAEQVRTTPESPLLRRAQTGPWKGLIPYALAGVAYALAVTELRAFLSGPHRTVVDTGRCVA